MPKIEYKSKRFQAKRLLVIDQVNEIIEEYQAQGYVLTLRQLYYQFVARGYIPNTSKEYNHLGCLVSDARLAGLVDWRAIVDRTRRTVENQHWESPKEIVEACVESFKLDTRVTQDNYIEIWVEKEALAGVIERTCRRLDVLSFACKGYVSQSSMWEAAQRLDKAACWGNSKEKWIKKGCRKTFIIHLGDHDPSGIDMTRDIQDRLELFGTNTKVIRIALTMEQVKEYSPPPNPAKLTDTRCDSYIAQYGNKSWELDALEPFVLDALITEHINKLTDEERLMDSQEDQEKGRKTLKKIADGL